MKFIFTYLFIATSMLMSAQSINWQKEDMEDAFGYTSTVDSQNNVIVVASGPFETQSTTMFVRKYDAAGSLLMQTSIDATQLSNDGALDHEIPYQITTDSQDNIIISGVNTLINTSPSPSCQTPPCFQSQAAKIWKLSPDGQLVFNKTLLDHSNSFDQLLDDNNYLVVDDNDNIYYNGIGSITDTDNDTAFGAILIKLAPDGTTLFTDVQDILGSANSISSGIMASGSDFISMANQTTFDNKLSAWDSNGNFLWSVDLDDSIEDLKSIIVDENTNDTYVLADSFPPNPILTKVDANGNIVYTQTYSLGETVVSQGLAFVASDKLAFAASTWSDSGNDSSLHVKVVNTSDGSNISDQMHTLTENLSRIRDAEADMQNGVYYVAVNSTNNGGSPSSGTLYAYDLNGSEWHATNPSPSVRSLAIGQGPEVYVMTDNAWNLYQYDTTLSVDYFESNISVDIHPNPVQDHFFINTQQQLKQIVIYDLSGKMVYKRSGSFLKNSPFDVSKLKTGIYLLQMVNDQGVRISRRIIKK
jgi:hypothetical protein